MVAVKYESFKKLVNGRSETGESCDATHRDRVKSFGCGYFGTTAQATGYRRRWS